MANTRLSKILALLPLLSAVELDEVQSKIEELTGVIGGWSVADIIHQAKQDGYNPTKEQAQRILELMMDKADSSEGISWDTVAFWIDQFNENFEKLEEYDEAMQGVPELGLV